MPQQLISWSRSSTWLLYAPLTHTPATCNINTSSKAILYAHVIIFLSSLKPLCPRVVLECDIPVHITADYVSCLCTVVLRSDA